MEKINILLMGFILGIIISMLLMQSTSAKLECEDGTYYTKAICFYQPDNELCPIYCEDYYMYCLKGKYILQKKDGEYSCLTVEEYLNKNNNYEP